MQLRRLALGLVIGLVGCAETAVTPSPPSPTVPLAQATTTITPQSSGVATLEPATILPAIVMPTETVTSIPATTVPTPTTSVAPAATEAPLTVNTSGSLVGFVTAMATPTVGYGENSDQPQSIEVRMLNLDGSLQNQISVPCTLVTEGKSQQCGATVLAQVPNQHTIVLDIGSRGLPSSLYAVELDTETVQILADNGAQGPITFSPDGSQMTFIQTEPITYAHPTGISNAIWGLNWNSGERYPITLGAYWYQDMTWADNDLLYFSFPTIGTPPGGWEIHQVRMSDDLPHSKFTAGMIKGVFADQSRFIVRTEQQAPAGSASKIYSLDLLDPVSLETVQLWEPYLEFSYTVLMSPDRMRAALFDQESTRLTVLEATGGVPNTLLDTHLSLGCKGFSETNPCIPHSSVFWSADSQNLLYWEENRLIQLSIAGELQEILQLPPLPVAPSSLLPIFEP